MEKQDHISLLREYRNVFAWCNEDMPGLDPQVSMHQLNTKSDAKLVRNNLLTLYYGSNQSQSS